MMLLSIIDAWDAQIHTWASALGWPMEGFLRLVLAALAGGLVGLDREVRGRQAGFRTNMLVCCGSTLVMLVSIQFAGMSWPHDPGVNVNVDPARIAYGVMQGVGFLGAGTIIHNKGAIRGLTTAAALWCVAAVGLSIGLGLYVLSAMATLLIVAVLWLLDYIEDIVPKQRYRIVTLRTPYRPGCIAQLIGEFKQAGIKVVDTSLKRDLSHSFAEIDIHMVFYRIDAWLKLEERFATQGTYQLIAARERARMTHLGV